MQNLPAGTLFTCQPGYEALLSGELESRGLAPVGSGPGWVLADGAAPEELCFAHVCLADAVGVAGDSINALAGHLLELFLERMRDVRLPDGWPLIFRFADGEIGLGQRGKSVEKEFRARLKKRMARLERTAGSELPKGVGDFAGLFVFMSGFDRLHAATSARSGGQRRMADDPAAPSRSYLKTEEAFAVMGIEPAPGETVVDLGAAPGGWSYSAARRGATVIAIDNGPMKGGAKDHPLIRHLREDAFKFLPADSETHDWLFCDLVEDPYHVMRLLEQWLKGRHCRKFVVNLKFGRADALGLLAKVNSRIRPLCAELAVRHLFHDRDEFTLVGRVPQA